MNHSVRMYSSRRTGGEHTERRSKTESQNNNPPGASPPRRKKKAVKKGVRKNLGKSAALFAMLIAISLMLLSPSGRSLCETTLSTLGVGPCAEETSVPSLDPPAASGELVNVSANNHRQHLSLTSSVVLGGSLYCLLSEVRRYDKQLRLGGYQSGAEQRRLSDGLYCYESEEDSTLEWWKREISSP